jgi:O-antigen/teichoic acid export membrane protein
VRQRLKDKLLGNKPLLWLLAQTLLVRLTAAVKLLLVAGMLGPAGMGVFALVLMMLATAELLSDTGLPTAIVQDLEEPGERKLGAAWVVLMVRGVALAVIFVVCSPWLATFFHAESSAWVFVAASGITVVKGALHPRYFRLQRDRRFDRIAPIEIGAALTDAVTCLALVARGGGAFSLVAGAYAAEMVRVGGSWMVSRDIQMKANVDFHLVRDYAAFGRWIWGASCMTLILNNFDKFILGRVLGPQELGLYQTSLRISQMAVSDLYSMLAVYMLPTLAAKRRESQQLARSYLKKVLAVVAILASVTAMVLAMCAGVILERVLGPGWGAAERILQLGCLATVLGAIIAILVSYHKAVGQSRNVAIASALQLAFLVPLALMLGSNWGGAGVVLANCGALLVAMTFMLYTALWGRA